MNVSFKNNDAVSGLIKIEIVKADYSESVEKSLRSFRQKANFPGFRKGKVPTGMVKKVYGKQALLEEVNKLVSENLFSYIREQKLNVLGEPMPNETEQKELDFDNSEEFEFCFDVALAPSINVELSKDDTLPYYAVEVNEEMLNSQVEAYANNFGEMVAVEQVEEKDMMKGLLAELENGEVKEGGIQVEGAIMMPFYMKNDEEKAKFVGATKNTVITFNPKVAYDGAAAEISALLKIEKEQVETLDSDFSFEVQEITRHQKAELNADLFNKVFADGSVTTEEEFKSKIKNTLAEQFTPQSDYMFLTDAKELLLNKVGDLEIADDLLKRWLVASNENNTAESIEAEYPLIKKDLTFHLIREHLLKANEVGQIEQAEMLGFAKRIAAAQFAQYGMMSIPEEHLVNYAQDLLKNEETKKNIFDRLVEEKLAALIKGQIAVEEKIISSEDFSKMMQSV